MKLKICLKKKFEELNQFRIIVKGTVGNDRNFNEEIFASPKEVEKILRKLFKYKEHPLQKEITGDFPEMYAFLIDYDGSYMMGDIDTIDVTYINQDGDELVVEVTQ